MLKDWLKELNMAVSGEGGIDMSSGGRGGDEGMSCNYK